MTHLALFQTYTRHVVRWRATEQANTILFEHILPDIGCLVLRLNDLTYKQNPSILFWCIHNGNFPKVVCLSSVSDKMRHI